MDKAFLLTPKIPLPSIFIFDKIAGGIFHYSHRKSLLFTFIGIFATSISSIIQPRNVLRKTLMLHSLFNICLTVFFISALYHVHRMQ